VYVVLVSTAFKVVPVRLTLSQSVISSIAQVSAVPLPNNLSVDCVNQEVVIAPVYTQLVTVPAFQVVSWLPVVFTQGKFMFAVQSKLTPPISLAVSSFVALPAFQVIVVWSQVFVPLTLSKSALLVWAISECTKLLS
jgi:hypothetical protein